MWSYPRKPESEVMHVFRFAVLWMCLFLDLCYYEIKQHVLEVV